MKPTVGNSYLVVKCDGSTAPIKATILAETGSYYHVRWGNGNEEWKLKHGFLLCESPEFLIKEDLGKSELIEADEYKNTIRFLAHALSDAAGFYEQTEKKDNLKITPAYKRTLRADAERYRKRIEQAFILIGDKKPS